VAKKITPAAPPPAPCGTLEEIQRYCSGALGVGDGSDTVGAEAAVSDWVFFLASAAFAVASC
jgi:hypothetical protein